VRTQARTTFAGEETMFDNLDEQIERAEGTSSTYVERLVRYLLVALLSVVSFGGLFLAVWLLEY
jgi:hypothetical protein